MAFAGEPVSSLEFSGGVAAATPEPPGEGRCKPPPWQLPRPSRRQDEATFVVAPATP